MYHLNTLKHIYHTKVYTSLALLHSIYESHLRSGLRRTGLFLHDYSASRETSLSFGERPLASCPGFRPGLHGTGYPQISPSIQKWIHSFFNCRSATLSSFFRYRGISPPSRQRRIGWRYLLTTGCHAGSTEAYSHTVGVYCCTRKG